MSSIGFGLLKSIIENNIALSEIARYGVYRDKFIGKEQEAFIFIQTHFLTYGRYPEIRTIEAEISAPSIFANLPSEPIGYWSDQIRHRWQHNKLTQLRDQISDQLADASGTSTAISSMNSIYDEIARDTNSILVKDMFNIQREVINHHRMVQQMSVIPGVPFGIEFLDSVSGGAQAGDIIVIVGESGVGKCLAYNTPIIMYDGSIKMSQDIIVGDDLLGPDSNKRRVFQTNTGIGAIYKIEPIKGDIWYCNGPHILSLKVSSNFREYKHGDIINISVDDYLKKSEQFKRRTKLYRTGVDFPHEEVFAPYVIGLYLADGTKSDSVIHCGNKKIEAIDYLETVCTVTKKDFVKGCWRCRIRDFNNIRRELITEDKQRFIPKRYMINSVRNRLELLAGIIDGDGYLHNNGFEVICKDKSFADQVAFLSRSVGLAVSIHQKIGRIKSYNFEQIYYRLFIYGDTHIIPNKISNKKATHRLQNKNALVTGFTVTYDREDTYYGIGIGADHLYLLQDFTVVHNTWLSLKLARAAREANYNVLAVCTEMPELQVARRDLAMKAGINSNDLKMGRVSGFGETRMQEFLNLSEERTNTENSFYKMLPGGIFGTYETIATVVKETKPHLLVVDGASLVRMEKFNGSRWERIIEIIEKFKFLAMQEDQLRIILTFHYGKDGPGKQSNIYGGMAIGQFASIILSFELERQEDRLNPSPVQYRNLKLIKGRDGETGVVRVLYDMRRSSITQDSVIQGNASEQIELNVEEEVEQERQAQIEEI